MTISPTPDIAPITAADREKAKELCAEATPGTWHVRVWERRVRVTHYNDEDNPNIMNSVDIGAYYTKPEDAAFIAFSRTAIPAYESRVVGLEAALADLQQVRANLEADVIRLRKAHGAERYWEARWRDEEARATALLEALRPFAQVARNLPGYIGDDAALRITVTRTLHGIRRQNTLSVDGVNAGDLRRVAAIRTHEVPNDQG